MARRPLQILNHRSGEDADLPPIYPSSHRDDGSGTLRWLPEWCPTDSTDERSDRHSRHRISSGLPPCPEKPDSLTQDNVELFTVQFEKAYSTRVILRENEYVTYVQFKDITGDSTPSSWDGGVGPVVGTSSSGAPSTRSSRRPDVKSSSSGLVLGLTVSRTFSFRPLGDHMRSSPQKSHDRSRGRTTLVCT